MKRLFSPSKITLVALELFAAQLEAARREQRMTQAELAERVGVSINTIKSVLRGKPQAAMGTAFECASVLGVPLFDEEPARKVVILNELRARLKLLPKAGRGQRGNIDDDF